MIDAPNFLSVLDKAEIDEVCDNSFIAIFVIWLNSESSCHSLVNNRIIICVYNHGVVHLHEG